MPSTYQNVSPSAAEESRVLTSDYYPNSTTRDSSAALGMTFL
ncbi:hypothetical protein HNQ93_001103 [Hymenobacter luteus]|uniref:Uncharacterized protein n=2 Tax=Hymenobacter TaxID=89966 RepID=A0A7W9SZB6_9BACT|nr:hypothetical protein [Hymenobacter latericoloratus]MBB6058273.1 hypothetical protein [Hymenobacter luteus]